jgi:hypothetical protein
LFRERVEKSRKPLSFIVIIVIIIIILRKEKEKEKRLDLFIASHD